MNWQPMYRRTELNDKLQEIAWIQADKEIISLHKMMRIYRKVKKGMILLIISNIFTTFAKRNYNIKPLNKKSMCSSKECIRIITENKDLIEKKYGVKSITLFGSVARGDNRQISHDAIQIL